MRWVKRFGLFWYHFVIGDEWTLAVAVVVAALLTWALATVISVAWIVMPLSVATVLAVSLGRAQRAANTEP